MHELVPMYDPSAGREKISQLSLCARLEARFDVKQPTVHNTSTTTRKEHTAQTNIKAELGKPRHTIVQSALGSH